MRRVSDIPSQGSPTAEEAVSEAADVGAGSADVGDYTEQGSPRPVGNDTETQAGAVATEQVQPTQPPTAKRKWLVGQAAFGSAASDEEAASAPTSKHAASATQTAATGGASTAEPRGTPATQSSRHQLWRQQRHKRQALDSAATQPPAPTVKTKATNGEHGRILPAPSGHVHCSSVAHQSCTDPVRTAVLSGGPSLTRMIIVAARLLVCLSAKRHLYTRCTPQAGEHRKATPCQV